MNLWVKFAPKIHGAMLTLPAKIRGISKLLPTRSRRHLAAPTPRRASRGLRREDPSGGARQEGAILGEGQVSWRIRGHHGPAPSPRQTAHPIRESELAIPRTGGADLVW